MTFSPTGTHPDDRGQHGNTVRADAPDAAVFVDTTGRRALLLRRAAVAFGAAVIAYAGMVGVAFMGGPSLAPSQLTPFGNAGTAQETGGDGVRPAGSSSEGNRARPCRKHCGKKCRRHPERPCRGRQLKKALDSQGGNGTGARSGDGAGGGAAPARSAPSDVEGR